MERATRKLMSLTKCQGVNLNHMVTSLVTKEQKLVRRDVLKGIFVQLKGIQRKMQGTRITSFQTKEALLTDCDALS